MLQPPFSNRKNFFFFSLLIACIPLTLTRNEALCAEPPVLTVVVSVDQLAYEYFVRFEENFGEEGIYRRVRKEGAWFTECHHGHAFTYTGPGHAVQLTGCYPSEHGIVDNDWFDRAKGKKVYCVSDEKAKIIGTTGNEKPVSPKNLLADTLGDRLKSVTNRQAKVFGVAIKDRASILMCGHAADAAFWMSGDGKWITTDAYRPDLPGYLRNVNERGDVGRFRGETWNLLLPPAKYRHGMPEESFGERPVYGLTKDFPHRLEMQAGDAYIRQLAASPYGNLVTLEAAKTVLEAEELGGDAIPDLLCINLSSNDYIGHAFGPHSLEVEDMTYQTDLQLGRFFEYVEKHLDGKPWVFALTADHAVCPVPEIAAKMKLPAGRSPFGKEDSVGNFENLRSELDKLIRSAFRASGEEETKLVQAVLDNEVFLNIEHPLMVGERYSEAQRMARAFMLKQPAVAAAVTRDQLLDGGEATDLERMFRRSFHATRSGDVLFCLQPYHIHGGVGTTHGSPWKYDTHVPLMLLAGGSARKAGVVKPGTYRDQVSPPMLAPTLASIIKIPAPAKCTERAIVEALGE